MGSITEENFAAPAAQKLFSVQHANGVQIAFCPPSLKAGGQLPLVIILQTVYFSYRQISGINSLREKTYEEIKVWKSLYQLQTFYGFGIFASRN